MTYKIDKEEICSLLDCFRFKKIAKNNSYDIILNITKEIGNDFLDGRGKYIREQYEQDDEFKNKISKLSFICDKDNRLCTKCPISKYCNTYIKSELEKNKDSKLKMIDLFCGAGGLSLGFTQVGFIPYLANDIQDCCIDTYSHNHPEVSRDNIILGDIGKVIDKIDKMTDDICIDIVVGGPPCQGFSMANRQRLIDDPRNKLYKYYIEVINKVKPKFFVMENVKGMLSVASQVKEDFENNLYYANIRASHKAIPQNTGQIHLSNFPVASKYPIGILYHLLNNSPVFPEYIWHTILSNLYLAL